MSPDLNHEEHEDHAGYEEDHDRLGRQYSMRLPGPLTPKAELAMTNAIGAGISVHRELGPGFVEPIYQQAMHIELVRRGIAFEAQRTITVAYQGTEIGNQRVDLVVEGLIVVELKAVIRFEEIHRAQLVSYLRTMGLRGGLLLNFRVPVLSRGGIRRVVL